MKDLILFFAFVFITLGIVAAIPVFGIVVGIVGGLWFLWSAKQEHDNAQKDN